MKNYTAVPPRVFFSVDLIFSIHFTVTAAGSIETPHPLFRNLSFPDKAFRKVLLKVWPSHMDCDLDAAGEAHETRVPVCDSAPCWEPWCPWHAEGCSESCEHTLANPQALNCFSCPSSALGHTPAHLLLPMGWSEPRQCPAGWSHWQSLSPLQAGLLPSLYGHLLFLGNLSHRK